MGKTPLVLFALALRICNRDAPPPGVIAGTAPMPGALVAGPPATHGGRVQVVGPYAVETVAARTGGVAMFWTDLQGRPIPPDQIALPDVRVNVNGGIADVPVRVANGAFVANVPVPAAAPVSVIVPRVVVAGVPYEGIEVPHVAVVAALPGIIVAPVIVAPVIVGPRFEFGWHGKHRKFRGGGRWH